MISQSDISIIEVLPLFNNLELDVSFISPTKTGLDKSIMDATMTVRNYLKETSIHDYSVQRQGPEAKKIVRSYFVFPSNLQETTTSLYRPLTKNGDPRIWFKNLNKYAEPNNLLAILCHANKIYILNCSNVTFLSSLENSNSPLRKIFQNDEKEINPYVEVLINKLKTIQNLGYIKTLRSGSTGVGKTLENILGIADNSSRLPDFHGIEIKAKRIKINSTRTTLFSKIPNWEISPIRNAWNLLETYGQFKNGKLRLNHELRANKVNSFGFTLEIDQKKDLLKNMYVDIANNNSSNHILSWMLPDLREALRVKHNETFWVGAKTIGQGIDEQFHYTQVQHTKKPIIRNVDTLIESGIISVDYLMSDKGNNVVRDHGYLFKIHQKNLSSLFPEPKNYVL